MKGVDILEASYSWTQINNILTYDDKIQQFNSIRWKENRCDGS